MVSITPDDGCRPPTYEPLHPDHVYELCRQYKADELQTFLALPTVAASELLQENYRRLCEPESRDDFSRRLVGMSPDDRWAFERRMVAGYHASIERDALLAARAADGATRSPALPGEEPDATTRGALAALERLISPSPGPASGE